ILFIPEESVDLNGNTGPFIQYAHARIASLIRKGDGIKPITTNLEILPVERELIKYLTDYPAVIQQAATDYSPALVANYTFDLVKLFNSFYQSVSIFKEDDLTKQNFRLLLSETVG